MKTFKKGDNVVHLSHGIGVIHGIEEREFSPGKVTRFYIVLIEDCGAPKKVFVPVDAAETRLRSVMTRETANEVLAYIAQSKDTSGIEHQTWNMRADGTYQNTDLVATNLQGGLYGADFVKVWDRAKEVLEELRNPENDDD